MTSAATLREMGLEGPHHGGLERSAGRGVEMAMEYVLLPRFQK